MTIFPLVMILAAAAQQPTPADFKLHSTLIDKHPTNNVRALRADTMNRLFVGAGESLFVYEPKNGGYEPRKIIYRFPLSSQINDIEVRGDNLFVLTSNALYVFVDGVRKRSDLSPAKLIWGVPMSTKSSKEGGFSALAWGPEGDLYFALSGPVPTGQLGYWTFFCQPNETKVPYRGVGGVFRCKPDGSDLRFVAEGLRQAGGLAFDREWNLFASDHFGQRIIHVTPHARLTELVSMGDDAGKPGPWYIDEPALPKPLRNRLMFYRGGDYWCYGLMPEGCSFKREAPISMPNGPGAVSIGCGGQMFAIVSQCEVRKLTNGGDPKVHAFEPYEPSEATPERLWHELSAASWQGRSRAHLEIARRGGALLTEANKRLHTTKSDDPAFPHLIWLAAKTQQGSLHLFGLVQHTDAKVRVQAIRALTEFPEQLRDEPIFTKAILDHDAHVRLAAVAAYFNPKVAFDAAIQRAIERGPALEVDPRMRQLAALLLARKATFRQIEALCGRVDPAQRGLGVRMAGYRLTLPARGSITSQLPLTAIPHVVAFADGVVDLSARGRVGLFTTASHWKADMHTVEQELLFKLLVHRLDDEEKAVRVRAALFLTELEMRVANQQ